MVTHLKAHNCIAICTRVERLASIYPRKLNVRLLCTLAEVSIVKINVVGAVRVSLGHLCLEPAVVFPLGQYPIALLISPVEALDKNSGRERIKRLAIEMLHVDSAVIIDLCDGGKFPFIITVLVDDFGLNDLILRQGDIAADRYSFQTHIIFTVIVSDIVQTVLGDFCYPALVPLLGSGKLGKENEISVLAHTKNQMNMVNAVQM